MKDVRLYSTENEKIAKELLGTDSNFTSVNMKENSLDSLIKKRKLVSLIQKQKSTMKNWNRIIKTLKKAGIKQNMIFPRQK